MKTIDELDLHFLPVDEPCVAENPAAFFAEAKDTHPWLATSNIGYYVYEYTALKDLLVQDTVMRPSFDGIVAMMNAKGTPWGGFTERQMIAHVGDSHKRLRDLLAPRFTPRQADNYRVLMRAVISDLLDEWVPNGSFDFEEFSSYFPISVMMEMVGAPVAEIPGLRSSLEALGQGFSMDPTHMPKLQEAILVLDEFVHRLMTERRATPLPEGEDDLLDVMLSASKEGNLTDRELADLLIFLFVAGYDTSKNVLTLTMNLLIDDPEAYARCALDIGYCGKVLEESLRYASPAATFRKTAEDIVYRDVLIPKDTMLFFPLNIVGRDADAFANPDTFDPERVIDTAHRHVAFGRGAHMCLGQYIARAQLQEGLHLIAQRIKNPQRVGAVGWRPFPGVWGIKKLQIEFTPG